MGLFAAMDRRILYLQQGLQPDSLKFWHRVILADTRARAPPWLHDKINIKQDPHLPMKFNLDISKRAASYYMMAVEAHLDMMPNSTRLYFLRVCETLDVEIDKNLV